jgi:hypothetical protein
MRHTAGLVAAVIGLLLVLEVLSALFDAVCEALAKDMAKQVKAPIWAAPFVFLRWICEVDTVVERGAGACRSQHR